MGGGLVGHAKYGIIRRMDLDSDDAHRRSLFPSFHHTLLTRDPLFRRLLSLHYSDASAPISHIPDPIWSFRQNMKTSSRSRVKQTPVLAVSFPHQKETKGAAS